MGTIGAGRGAERNRFPLVLGKFVNLYRRTERRVNKLSRAAKSDLVRCNARRKIGGGVAVAEGEGRGRGARIPKPGLKVNKRESPT